MAQRVQQQPAVQQPSATAFESLRAQHFEATSSHAARKKPNNIAPPQYMNKKQEFVLKMSQDAGWVIRSMVADTKTHKVAISIEKDGETAWIVSDGSLKSEAEVVKASGSV